MTGYFHCRTRECSEQCDLCREEQAQMTSRAEGMFPRKTGRVATVAAALFILAILVGIVVVVLVVAHSGGSVDCAPNPGPC